MQQTMHCLNYAPLAHWLIDAVVRNFRVRCCYSRVIPSCIMLMSYLRARNVSYFSDLNKAESCVEFEWKAVVRRFDASCAF